MRTITVLGLIVISGGCTVATHDTAETPASSETTEKTTTTSSSIANPLTDDSAATASTTETNLFGGDDPEDFLMPDVLCMNLQAAQDEIQDHGVFFLTPRTQRVKGDANYLTQVGLSLGSHQLRASS